MEVIFDPDRICSKCMLETPNKNEICPHCGFYLPSYTVQPHHLPMQTILNGRYLLGIVLGEGGFGITYSAYDLKCRQRVAIKELFIAGVVSRQGGRTVLMETGEGMRKYYGECRNKFLMEAKVLQMLQDKSGVVNIYEYFRENDTAYIVMEYLDGIDLRTFLKLNGGRISYQSAYRFLRPIMKSMMEIHRSGIIHRDISPDNIRYLSNKKMKLMDFGSAKSTVAEKTESIVIMFKPGYTPPEQYASGYMVGPWMDVYAMAATLYRCITGKTPKISIERVNDSDLESPRSLGADITPEIEEVLYKGMALDPTKRYLDMREFYMALKSASQGMIQEPNSDWQAGKVKTEDKKVQENQEKKNISEDMEYKKLLDEIKEDKKSYSWLYALIIVEIVLVLLCWLAQH